MKEFAVSPIFSDGMVIQRDVPTTIWGTAPEGAAVTIQLGAQYLETRALDGNWQVASGPLAAGGPYQMIIRCENREIFIKDILAGEVWIAGGQSNMEWPLKNSVGGREAIDAASFPQIRSFNVPKLLYEGEEKDNPEKFARRAVWRMATPDHVGEFSAVAYYFALDLHHKLGIPVGIIDCNLGGSSASAWTSQPYLLSDPDVRSYVDEYDASVRRLDLEDYMEKATKIARAMSQSPFPIDPEQENETYFDLSDLPEHIKNLLQVAIQPGPRSPFGYPGSLFNNMLSTVVPYTARGVIFYQGESDDTKACIYAKLFALMIQCWRDAFHNPDLWFLFVQLAAYGREGNPDGDMYPLVREQQYRVANSAQKTAMAVAMDVGHLYDIHPRRKKPVGQRLALLARANIYGEEVECSGPVYRGMTIDGNRLVLEFDHAESGLSFRGDKLQGFRICAANRLYFDADAQIVENNVVLSSPNVHMPAAASYGWANHMAVNLYNSAGLPAVPFKTDKYL